MSMKVALEDLADEVTKRGPGYLLTTRTGGRPHVMHVRFAVEGRELRVPIGRSAAANIGDQPAVTLLWQPQQDGDYSLIVDGEATVAEGSGTDGNPVAVIEAIGAVLHRPA
ncbi:MAG: pyridoxamine 5'-phosphate oxidase family protein [Acidimicrobiia bacterium]|nr:pyridoxamine 5'-phosphate oxidase family protein [Acidimicrobiia bacterium]